MFPIGDTVRTRSFPIVNWLIIIANVAVFVLVELPLKESGLNRLLLTYGLVPTRLLAGEAWGFVTIFTSMFLHGGWIHLISNMWALFIFGDNVEDRMGSGRYLLFYLLTGALAAVLQSVVAPASQLPMVGASGAIAGVLGAYIVLYPSARVNTFFLLILIPVFIDIPAILYIGFWFVSQFFSGVMTLDANGLGGVAYWAHIGGFLSGLVLLPFFARRPRPVVYKQSYSNPYLR